MITRHKRRGWNMLKVLITFSAGVTIGTLVGLEEYFLAGLLFIVATLVNVITSIYYVEED